MQIGPLSSPYSQDFNSVQAKSIVPKEADLFLTPSSLSSHPQEENSPSQDNKVRMETTYTQGVKIMALLTEDGHLIFQTPSSQAAETYAATQKANMVAFQEKITIAA